MTQNNLRKFIRACVRDGRPQALDLGREAFKRLQQRA